MTQTSMSLIADRISHRYGSLEVLRDITFATEPGEIVALVGPSGCGKSTLLAILGGLLQPSAGHVYMQGEPRAGGLNPLTFVFQDFALLPWCSVGDNIRFVLKHQRLSTAEIETIVSDVLRRTALADFEKALPKQLSGGMRQRVGIARALAVRPSMLLMDEPLSALDSQTRELLMDDFVQLITTEGVAAIYVTHNLEEAARLADRAIVFSRRPGQIREILRNPIARKDRAQPSARIGLQTFQSDLWTLIREEAAVADREMVNV